MGYRARPDGEALQDAGFDGGRENIRMQQVLRESFRRIQQHHRGCEEESAVPG